MEVGASISTTAMTSSTASSYYSSMNNNNINDDDDIPISPIRERTQKAIAQHRAWRQPDLRRSYAGISVSAVSQRHTSTTTTYNNNNNNNNPSQHNHTNDLTRSVTIPNISLSYSGGSSTIPFDAAAAAQTIYEDIESLEQRLLHNSDDFVDNIHNLQPNESSILPPPSKESDISLASDRSLNDDEKLVDTSTSYHKSEVRENNNSNRLGIEANRIYDTNPTNEMELLRRQQYVYESYRTLNQSSIAVQQIDATTATQQQQPTIVFRDDESAGTGLSQQELIRKKARTSRRRRLGGGNKMKRPILHLPVQLLLLPPRISTPQRQSSYRTIHEQQQEDIPFSQSKSHRKTNNKYLNTNDNEEQVYDDPEEEMESSSTTAETANESGDTTPDTGRVASAMRMELRSSNSGSARAAPPTNRQRRQPTLAVRGDDALLWVEPIDQRSVGDDSLPAISYLLRRDVDHGVNNDNKITTMEKVVPIIIKNEHSLPPKIKRKSSTVVQLPKMSVRFAKSQGNGEDDESSMPWDQKTDLNGTTPIASPASVLDNIIEEVPESSLVKAVATPTSELPKSILRKSRYTASQKESIITNDNRSINGTTLNDADLGGNMNYHSQQLSGEMEDDQIFHSRDLSPPRMSIGMVDIEGLELSPIPPGLESENQSIEENNNVDVSNSPQSYNGLGHPAEKHIQRTMATFLAMRDGELVDHVRDQENYPDPPLEIDIDDDETVLSAYVFIETVAAIVIQTAVRQFLATLYLDSLRQTRDSFDVAQRVLSIEESCIDDSMIASSRATSSTGSERNEYSYENLIDDDLDRAALDMYELAAIQIQSVYRGFWVRDCLDVDHYCATVLQRMYRGLRCRRTYARDLRRIILVQSWCRRNIARDSAANILAYAIVIQSAVRAHIAQKRYVDFHKKKLLIKQAAATSIQSRWRSFVCEAHFIRALVDVLIVQTVVRKWLALQKVAHTRRERQLTSKELLHSSLTTESQVSVTIVSTEANKLPELQDDARTLNSPNALIPKAARDKSATNHLNLNANLVNFTSHQVQPKSLSLSHSTNSIPPPVSHMSSAKIVNKKSMDVSIVNDTKWRTAAARCITPETKKMYTKSKVVAYPISDDDVSSCNESYTIVRNTGPSTTPKGGDTIDHEAMLIANNAAVPGFEDTCLTHELAFEVPKQGTTTNLLSMWKEKEKKNGQPHRKALV